MSNCFLDTSAVLDIFRRRPHARAAIGFYDRLFLPFVVLGELTAGSYRAQNPAAEMKRIREWLQRFEVVGADMESAFICGELMDELECQGKRIPTNDVWVAAIAVQFDLPLLARDRHFGRLSRLRWVDYAA